MISGNEEIQGVSVFWDFASTQSSSAASTISTYEMVKNIRSGIAPYGSLQSIEVYWDFDGHATQSSTTRLRAELSASGVSLIDCPGQGREGVAIKKMLADMIFYAWDHPAPHTFVVITGDRDIAYALAMLEMKDYRIVLISPACSHPDLTSQASVQLDWSRVVLGTHRGVNHERGLGGTQSSRVRPSSTRLRKSTFSCHQEPFTHQSNNLPSKERSPAFFKSNDLGFDVFGNEDLHSVYMRSPKTMGSLGLGDGPLFPRPQSRHAARSGSANVFHCKHSEPPLFTVPTSGSKEGGACLHKGKGRALDVQPEDTAVQPPSPCRDQLTFGPFNDNNGPVHPGATPSLSEGRPSRKNSGSTVVSRPESQESRFSYIDVPAPMPAKDNDGHPDKTDAVKQESRHFVSKPPDDIYRGALSDAGPSQPKIDASPAWAPLPATFMPVTRAHIFSPPKPVSLPEKWAPLVKFLRKSGGIAVSKKLITKLLRDYPDATAIAGCKQGMYIDMAIKEGVVKRTLVNEKKNIQLTAMYASYRT